jgi:hypothetical protein
MHYKKLLDPGIYLGPQDFFDGPKKLTISRAVRESIETKGDAGDSKSPQTAPKQSAPMLYFIHNGVELPRRYKIPATVLYGLSLLLGKDCDQWHGKDIVIEVCKCMSFGEIEDCLRVQFPAEIEDKIHKYLKKRKLNVKCYKY